MTEIHDIAYSGSDEGWHVGDSPWRIKATRWYTKAKPDQPTTDGEAAAHVWREAKKGSELHRRVLAFLWLHNKPEVEKIAKAMGHTGRIAEEIPRSTWSDRRVDVGFRPSIQLQRNPDGTWQIETDWSESGEGEWIEDENLTGEWVNTDVGEAVCSIADKIPMLKAGVFPVDPKVIKATRKGLKKDLKRARKRLDAAIAKGETTHTRPDGSTFTLSSVPSAEAAVRSVELALMLTK